VKSYLSAIRTTILLVVLTLAGLASGTASAQEDRRVRIINETSHIVRFFGSNAGTTDWEEDILGDKVLEPGQSVMINFDDGTGYCKFDFKAEFSDGDEVVKHGIDVCEISSFRFTE
jgi:hypothetical protein